MVRVAVGGRLEMRQTEIFGSVPGVEKGWLPMIEWLECGPAKAGLVAGKIEVMVEERGDRVVELRTPWSGRTYHPTALSAQIRAECEVIKHKRLNTSRRA